jgi:hypothetical protein
MERYDVLLIGTDNLRSHGGSTPVQKKSGRAWKIPEKNSWGGQSGLAVSGFLGTFCLGKLLRKIDLHFDRFSNVKGKDVHFGGRFARL